MEKSVETTLLDRRSIRRYEREPISEEDLHFIREAIRNTPTSYNGQQFSVIEVSDQDIKLKLEEIVGQKQMKTSARVFIFLADYNKIAVAAKAKNLENPGFENTMDGLIVGVVDASLAMMSAIVAANSRGLGTCPIGYARTADPAAISRLLNLPQGVFVVCALAVGVPREIPDLKPKQSEDLLIFPDSYGTEDMAGKLLDYDREFTEYHATRAGNTSDKDWIGEILGYYKEGMSYKMLDAVRAQGYGVVK
ncbi:MAG: nitroreductase family protein [Duncaniella sp.]|nr:nitroreductase family protein [Duncaniella sp.]